MLFIYASKLISFQADQEKVNMHIPMGPNQSSYNEIEPYSCKGNSNVQQKPQPHELITLPVDQIPSQKSYSNNKLIPACRSKNIPSGNLQQPKFLKTTTSPSALQSPAYPGPSHRPPQIADQGTTCVNTRSERCHRTLKTSNNARPYMVYIQFKKIAFSN